MDTDYIGKHRDDSDMARRCRIFRDADAQDDERMGRPEHYVGTHRKSVNR